jgi:hypothetical protein
VAPTTTVTTIPTNEIEPTRKKKQIKKGKRHQGGPCESNRALFAYCDVFFSLINSRYSSSIWGSTSHRILHEKHVQKHQNCRADQDPQTNNICNLSKILAKPTCNIKTKINNTTMIANPNFCA